MHCFAGEPEIARPFGQESVERARRLGGDALLAQSLLTYVWTIDPARSGQLYAEAIACADRSGDHLTNSMLHDNAGATALNAGDLPAARAHLEAAGHAAQQIGWESTTLRADLGWVLRAERDLDDARSAFEAVLRMAAGTAATGTWPSPSPAWPAWPGMRATGIGSPRCTASRKPFGTGRAFRGKVSMRVIAGTARTKRVRTRATSSWSGPTLRARRSASRRPSSWPSESETEADRVGPSGCPAAARTRSRPGRRRPRCVPTACAAGYGARADRFCPNGRAASCSRSRRRRPRSRRTGRSRGRLR